MKARLIVDSVGSSILADTDRLETSLRSAVESPLGSRSVVGCIACCRTSHSDVQARPCDVLSSVPCKRRCVPGQTATAGRSNRVRPASSHRYAATLCRLTLVIRSCSRQQEYQALHGFVPAIENLVTLSASSSWELNANGLEMQHHQSRKIVVAISAPAGLLTCIRRAKAETNARSYRAIDDFCRRNEPDC